MAEIKKTFGSVKRFGVRYGRKIKARLAEIESVSKRHQQCPYCRKMTAKRIAAGIWQCGKCHAKFTGGAYTVTVIEKKEELAEKAE